MLAWRGVLVLVRSTWWTDVGVRGISLSAGAGCGGCGGVGEGVWGEGLGVGGWGVTSRLEGCLCGSR